MRREVLVFTAALLLCSCASTPPDVEAVNEVHLSMIMLLKDDDPSVRETAVRSLSTLGARGAIPQIRELFNDEYDQIREYAIEAVWKLRDQSNSRLEDLPEE